MRNLVKLAAMGAAALWSATLGAIAPASAHGEKSQQAFLRMRTLNWYDVAWSKTTVNVNEDMVLSGKVPCVLGLAAGCRQSASRRS